MHHLEQQRRENREKIAALGLDPYGLRYDGALSLAGAAARYDEAADVAHQAGVAARKQAQKDHPGAAEPDLPVVTDGRPRVRVAGRVVLHRDNGKLVWINLRDETCESFQIAVSKRECDEAGFGVAKVTDLGDIIAAEGPLMRTKAGEITVWAESVRPMSKCLVPPPEKRAGLSDVETRYRQRYVDLWATPESMRVFRLRSELMSAARRHLEAAGFMEVETPMLQAQAGGAAARPFITHMNALDIELYLRIAPELYLKRLLVGGMRRVFEVNRNFRNEGLDKQHNPEFTMIELYEAYGDMESVMGVTENLVRELARVAATAQGAEGLTLPFGELEIDYARPFERVAYGELFERALGFPMSDTSRVRARAEELGLRVRDEKGVELDDVFVVNEVFEAVAEGSLDHARPTFITHYPSKLSPLTRPNRDDPAVADRADLFIGGMEIAPHYTELNDPDVQASKFREQLAGIDDEESTFRNFDEDFVRALKVGMPPAGGMGLGVDRVVMLLCNQRTIRDVVLFPLMRPEA
ncbi:MAG: lysine--tRNA ligase [Phycisphaeraceae bacterium]|nr:MAG: lysine--tRNA ligase [Phycisphaeraceae bacterium]